MAQTKKVSPDSLHLHLWHWLSPETPILSWWYHQLFFHLHCQCMTTTCQHIKASRSTTTSPSAELPPPPKSQPPRPQQWLVKKSLCHLRQWQYPARCVLSPHRLPGLHLIVWYHASQIVVLPVQDRVYAWEWSICYHQGGNPHQDWQVLWLQGHQWEAYAWQVHFPFYRLGLSLTNILSCVSVPFLFAVVVGHFTLNVPCVVTISLFVPILCALDLSKDNLSIHSSWILNWCVPRYEYINTSNDLKEDLLLSTSKLGGLNLEPIRWVSRLLLLVSPSDILGCVCGHLSVIFSAWPVSLIWAMRMALQTMQRCQTRT